MSAAQGAWSAPEESGPTIYHEVHGDHRAGAVPLILVHGGAGTIESHFGAVVSAMSTDRLVVGVEFQGHGHTPHADRDYTAENNAADLMAVLDRLELDRCDLLSFSNGCLTALRLVSDAPERVRRLVIASGFARRDGMVEGFWDQFDDPDPATLPPELADAYRRIAPDPDAVTRMFHLDVQLMRQATDWTDEDLARLDVPILFLSGDRDIVRPEHTIDLARRVPAGRAAIVPAGHGDYLGTSDGGDVEPWLVDATVNLVRGFLDSNTAKPAEPAP